MSRPNRSILGDHAGKLPVTVTYSPVGLEPAKESSMLIARTRPAVWILPMGLRSSSRRKSYCANGHAAELAGPDHTPQNARLLSPRPMMWPSASRMRVTDPLPSP